MRMMVKLSANAKKEGHSWPIACHTSDTLRTDSTGGTFRSNTSSVMAIAKTPSLKNSSLWFKGVIFLGKEK